jgi:uncharacterized membrane protein
MSDLSSNSIEIQAPATEVAEVLFDLANYPNWSTSTKKVSILESDANSHPTKVEISIEAGVLRDKVFLEYDWSKAPSEISFSLDDADLLTEMTGILKIKDNGDESSTVTYELTVGLSMPVPAMMRNKQELATINQTLKELKEKVEG